MLGGTALSYAVDFFLSRGCQAHRGANNSFILSAQEMNHRCNLIRLCHNLALRVSALLFAPVLAPLVDSAILSLQTVYLELSKPEHTGARAAGTVLSGGSDGERLNVILASHFCAAMAAPPCLYGNVCVRVRMCACVYVGLVRARVRGYIRSRARARVWERSKRTHFAGSLPSRLLSLSVSLSVSKAASSCRSS